MASREYININCSKSSYVRHRNHNTLLKNTTYGHLEINHQEQLQRRSEIFLKVKIDNVLLFITFLNLLLHILGQLVTVSSLSSFKHEVQQSINKETSLFWRAIRGHALPPAWILSHQRRTTTYKNIPRSLLLHSICRMNNTTLP